MKLSWLEQSHEIKRLKQWVNDLQSGMYVNCVYCGHRYGPEKDTPVSMADVLKAHIEQCPEHPMSKLKQQLSGLQKLYDDLISNRDEFADQADRWERSYDNAVKVIEEITKTHLSCMQQKDKALEMARCTFIALNNHGGLGYEKHNWIRETLTAINKASGGNDNDQPRT